MICDFIDFKSDQRFEELGENFYTQKFSSKKKFLPKKCLLEKKTFPPIKISKKILRKKNYTKKIL